MGGADGMTTKEIATSLEVQHQHVNEKVRRNRRLLESHGFKIIDAVANTTGSVFVVDVPTAKYLAATWKNNAGVAYFRYLLECERVAENVPNLIAELELARATIATLTGPKQKRIPGRGMVTVVTRVIALKTMFGEITTKILKESRYYDELSPEEKTAYKVRQRAAIMRGLAAYQDDDLNPDIDPEDLN
jgi:hypothetical protein